MNRKVIMIGSNPSNTSRGANTSTIRNLYKWMDIVDIKFFSFTNISTIRTPNNRPLNKDERELKRVCTEVKNYSIIVALGKTASRALRELGIGHFCLPHPSGLNRQLNDKEFIDDRLTSLQVYCSGRSTPNS